MERTTDSVESLASLMDRVDAKLDRRDDQYRPRIYQCRNRGHGYRQNNYRSKSRSYSRIITRIIIEEEETTLVIE